MYYDDVSVYDAGDDMNDAVVVVVDGEADGIVVVVVDNDDIVAVVVAAVENDAIVVVSIDAENDAMVVVVVVIFVENVSDTVQNNHNNVHVIDRLSYKPKQYMILLN